MFVEALRRQRCPKFASALCISSLDTCISDANLGLRVVGLSANTAAVPYFPFGSFDKSVTRVVTFCPFSMPPMSTRPSCVTSSPR